jgi:hypothetical protein
LAGSYYIEQPFKPLLTKFSPILQGIDPAGFPRLLGYNASTLKSAAEEVIKSPAGDPILAQWQYGLGRSVAWTPDVKGRWATDWVTWPKFSQFAAQMVSWSMPRESSPGLATTFSDIEGTADNMQADVRIESVDTNGSPRNFLSTSVSISSTNGFKTTVNAVQQSPGVYGAKVGNLKAGVYEVRVDQQDIALGNKVAQQVTGLVVPYPSEYRISADSVASAQALLSDVQQLGQGKALNIAQPAAPFTHDIVSQPRPIALWPWLLALAIVLFPVDVAVRRLTVSWADLRIAGKLIRRKM